MSDKEIKELEDEVYGMLMEVGKTGITPKPEPPKSPRKALRDEVLGLLESAGMK